VLVAFDATYAEHYPQQEGLMAQLKAKAFKAPELDTLAEQAAPGPNNAAAPLSTPERAQQLKLLRVLRHIVLPEMIPRVLL
jgi:type II secretory pathway component PulM